MLGGPDPVAALDLLRRLGLMHAVFGHDLGTDGRPGVAWEALRLLDLGLGREARRDLMAAAALLPVREERVPAAKGRHTSLAASLLRTALKWPTRSGERVEALHAAAPQLLQVLQEGLRVRTSLKGGGRGLEDEGSTTGEGGGVGVSARRMVQCMGSHDPRRDSSRTPTTRTRPDHAHARRGRTGPWARRACR